MVGAGTCWTLTIQCRREPFFQFDDVIWCRWERNLSRATRCGCSRWTVACVLRRGVALTWWEWKDRPTTARSFIAVCDWEVESSTVFWYVDHLMRSPVPQGDHYEEDSEDPERRISDPHDAMFSCNQVWCRTLHRTEEIHSRCACLAATVSDGRDLCDELLMCWFTEFLVVAVVDGDGNGQSWWFGWSLWCECISSSFHVSRTFLCCWCWCFAFC